MSTKKSAVKKAEVRTRFCVERVANGYTIDVTEESSETYNSKTYIFEDAHDVIAFLEGRLN